MAYFPYSFPYGQYPGQFAGQIPTAPYQLYPFGETQVGPIQYKGAQPGTIFVPLSGGGCWWHHNYFY